MEFIKFIAPWLPILAAAYILIKSRYYMLVLYRIIRKKIAATFTKSKQPVALAIAPPILSPTAPRTSSACQMLLAFPGLLIFSLCLGNEEDEFNDEESSAKFSNEEVNKVFGRLLKDREAD